MKCAVVDTNILMYVYLNKIDIFELLFSEGYVEVFIPSAVVDELKKLNENSKGKNKIAANFALKLVEKCEIEPTTEKGDDAVLQTALRKKCLLVTSDRELIKRAVEKGVETAYIREKRKLEFRSA